MNKYVSLTIGTALLLGCSSIALSTTAVAAPTTETSTPSTTITGANFADVPSNHWAYQAVYDLDKAGIITPDQDSMFHGNKVLTRYQFALAVSRVFASTNQIDTSAFAKDSDLQAFETGVNAKLISNEGALTDIQTLYNGLQPEFVKIEADDASVKASLTNFETGLKDVRAEQRRFHVRGEAISMFRDNVLTNSHDMPFSDIDGYRAGIHGNNSSFTNPSFSQEVLLGFDAPLSFGHTWSPNAPVAPIAGMDTDTTSASSADTAESHHGSKHHQAGAVRMPAWVTANDLNAGSYGRGYGRAADPEPRQEAQFHALIGWYVDPYNGYNAGTALIPWSGGNSNIYGSFDSVTSSNSTNVIRAYAQFPVDPSCPVFGDYCGRPRISLTGVKSITAADVTSADLSSANGDRYENRSNTYRSSFNDMYNYSVGDLLNPYQYGTHTLVDDRFTGLTVGILGEKFTPFTLQSDAPHSYFDLPEYDNGNVRIEGAKWDAGFKFAPLRLDAFMGKVQPSDLSGGASGNSLDFQYRPGSIVQGGITQYNTIDQMGGLNLTYHPGYHFELGATALVARIQPGIVFSMSADRARPAIGFATTTGAIDPQKGVPYNTITVLGLNGKAAIPGVKGLKFAGEFSICQTGANSVFSNVNSSAGNEALYGHFDYATGTWRATAGYQEIYNNFAAPGYWGKVGDWTNPTNVRGPVVGASFTASPSLTINTGFSLYNGMYNVGIQSPLGSDDTLDAASIAADYKICKSYSATAGFEWAQYDLKDKQDLLAAPGKPTEEYFNLGLSHPFSTQASIRLGYQYVTYDDDKTFFDPNGNSRGSVITSQVDYKF